MIELENAVVYHGSNLDVLPTLPDNSVDSVVTDPPYELGFMGKSWDSSGIAYSVELWQECMRVLKPGGHLLAFGGSRTWHRLAVAIEDAGFEMRDSIAWLYGSGFPKSLDVSKAIESTLLNGSSHSTALRKTEQDGNGESYELVGKNNGIMGETRVYERKEFDPITPEAQKWQGWGTALKPAFEPVVVARKPLIGTVAQNVLTYGTGGLNIDGSRIGTENTQRPSGPDSDFAGQFKGTQGGIRGSESGRWPANIILDPYTAELLDEQSGVSVSRSAKMGAGLVEAIGAKNLSNKAEAFESERGHNDSGGASRFFYVAKASKRDRNEGLEGLESASAADMVDREEGSAGMNSPRAGAGRTSGAKNFHPTVKPTSLMEYLIKLVTPEGGTVLDPFTGSGSTGKAALLNGFQFIGIELTEEYLPIIEGRLRWANEQRNQEASQSDKEEKETLF